MELNFKLQRNEDLRLQKLVNKMTRRHNRRHIVDDMIEVRKAKKAAVNEKNKYYTYQKVPAKKSGFSRWYAGSKLKKNTDRLILRVKTKIFSYESLYLYAWHTILDAVDYVRQRKKFYLSAAIILCAFGIGSLAYHYLFGYQIIFNGYSIGVVNNLSTFNQAMNDVNENLTSWYGNGNLYYEQSITVKHTFIGFNRSSVLDKSGCEAAIYGCDFPLFVDGGVVEIDGVETVRLASVEEAQQAVDELLSSYIGTNTDTEEVMQSQVVQNITVDEKIIQMGTEKSVDGAVAYLKSLSSTASDTGTASSDNSISSILTSNSNNKGLITALNFRSSEFSVGTTTAKPALTIVTVKEVSYTDQIPYGTTYQDDPTQYYGAESIASEGVNGTKQVSAVITYTNGAETSRQILSETVVTDPTNEVIARGTMPLPPAVSTGTFLIPTTGSISEIFGDSSHAGGCAVDISNSTGTTVYAADSGIVIKASYYGTYGNCIMIDHGNGYSTLYAHLSRFAVTVGQQVSQGQVIGYMGSTGYSTGPHLHFEIRYDGVREPILSFFSYFAVGVEVKALN
ncbi:MAG: M23 family metallopeptidase [Anaerofustis sp.]